MNFSDGGVLDTRRRFQAAVPALNHPAPRPTRGSGSGFDTDMSGAGEAIAPDEDDDVAHAATEISATASSERGERQQGLVMGCVLRKTARRAWCSCGRSRWFDRRSHPTRT